MAIDCSFANYFINMPSGTYCANRSTNRVGSESPKGDGKWGQSDLGGNVYEWGRDWNAPLSPTCDDCANLTVATSRVHHGGCFGCGEDSLRAADRNLFPPADRIDLVGVRCARPP